MRRIFRFEAKRYAAGFLLLCGSVLPTFAQQATVDTTSEPAEGGTSAQSFTSLVGHSAKDVLLDQRDIWTSPFRMNKETALQCIFLGGTTAALLTLDHPISRAVPLSGRTTTVGTEVSRLGQWYTVGTAGAALFGAGWLSHDARLTETGVSSLEALLDAGVVTEVMKLGARRDRPREGDGGGHFEKGGASFPSEHSTQAWAFASVIADEYGGERKWVPALAYGYAASVSAARVMAQQHFTSDVFVGGVIGFFVGHYVARTHRVANELQRSSEHSKLMPVIEPELAGSLKMANLSWSF